MAKHEISLKVWPFATNRNFQIEKIKKCRQLTQKDRERERERKYTNDSTKIHEPLRASDFYSISLKNSLDIIIA